MSKQIELERRLKIISCYLNCCNMYFKGEIKRFGYLDFTITTRNECNVLYRTLHYHRKTIKEQLNQIYAENKNKNDIRKRAKKIINSARKLGEQRDKEFKNSRDPLNLMKWLNSPLYEFYNLMCDISQNINEWSLNKICNLRD